MFSQMSTVFQCMHDTRVGVGRKRYMGEETLNQLLTGATLSSYLGFVTPLILAVRCK